MRAEYLGLYIYFMSTIKKKSNVGIKLKKVSLILQMVVLFSAGQGAARNVKNILDHYYKVSRQLVNLHNLKFNFFLKGFLMHLKSKLNKFFK